METLELNEMIENLTNRCEGINNWIENNPKSDIKIYEMADCLMQLGNIESICARKLSDEGVEMDHFSTHTTVYNEMPNYKKLDDAMRKMLQLRGVNPIGKDQEINGVSFVETNNGYKYVKNDFFLENPDAMQFLHDIYYETSRGMFKGELSLGKDLYNKKKDVLCKTAGVYLYCWQVRKNEPDYLFDNKEEMSLIMELPELKEQLKEANDEFYLLRNQHLDNMLESILSMSKFNESQNVR